MADVTQNITTIIWLTRAVAVIGSISVLILAIGAMPMLHKHAWVMLIGFAGVLYTVLAWWRDVVKKRARRHTPVVQLHHRYGMILFMPRK